MAEDYTYETPRLYNMTTLADQVAKLAATVKELNQWNIRLEQTVTDQALRIRALELQHGAKP